MDGKSYLLVHCNSKAIHNSLQKLSTNFDVSKAFSYQQIERYIKNRHFDFIIIQADIRDPNFIYLINNYDIISRNPSINFITLGNCNSKYERIYTLQAGAKDYIPIPFYIEELELRLKKQLIAPNKEKLQIEIDHMRKEIQIFETKVKLTKLEYNILNYLLKRNGAPCKEDLQSFISYTKGKQVSTNSLRVAIKRLEDKLEEQSGMRLIKNRHGIGYYIEI